jgi:tetratricopeptide (TPR) repeat protein
LYRRAIEAGDREALGHAARLLESADRVDEAVDLYRPAAEAGDRDALGYAAWLLERADRVDEAVALYLRAVEAGDRDTLGHGADSWRTATALMKRSLYACARPKRATLWPWGMRHGYWRRLVAFRKRVNFVSTGLIPAVISPANGSSLGFS